MKLPIEASHLPVRIVTGAFILNSGLDKRVADQQTAARLHGFAAGTYPVAGKIAPEKFVRLLSAGEITLGAALLLPVVPSLAAGAGLAAFSAGLLGLYFRTPGMRRPGSVRPTEQGVALAKDVWMLGAGLGLVVDALTRKGR
ncbi:hypothetical protein LWP59_14595 [Amycolatopsis acidiphila]|uniref:DoxX family membrane protein n=1 Tax=Amycolatopsis acidiphila TaxID=715473 RepID=A0A558AKJ8_9PSEU|nr:hypothetical protein [Amycolatopsis acidiphila]TVT24790.1 hypothetical protein FNH06_05295 [Amycolatopsis acidiphila]UIJ62763.1 hypothetical protein LWP59_14595 [Amycolatopsis acidiphila]GHG64026.1 hypothetical protein GCM10017788_20430 [Amycolatopsis acidiphila]